MRFVIPLIFGIAGVALLVGLGLWQVERLAWKRGILDQIDARITAAPVALPRDPVPEQHRYLPVAVTGTLRGETLRVLVSQKTAGAGYRLITALEDAEGRRILLDRGFVSTDAPLPDLPDGPRAVIGTVHWPDDRTSATPANDLAANIWFARDIDAMAQALATDPVLVVARSITPPEPGVAPLPVTSVGIPNDHLEYAVTWFSLAAIWAVMTLVFLWRHRRKN